MLFGLVAVAVRIAGENPAPGHATTPPARVFWLVLGGRDPPGGPGDPPYVYEPFRNIFYMTYSTYLNFRNFFCSQFIEKKAPAKIKVLKIKIPQGGTSKKK